MLQTLVAPGRDSQQVAHSREEGLFYWGVQDLAKQIDWMINDTIDWWEETIWFVDFTVLSAGVIGGNTLCRTLFFEFGIPALRQRNTQGLLFNLVTFGNWHPWSQNMTCSIDKNW